MDTGNNKQIFIDSPVVAPSILSADFVHLGEDVMKAVNAGAKFIHIDVMDGTFVPQISFGHPVIKSMRKLTDAVFDVHLMVGEPSRIIDGIAASGADIITVHAEACTHLDRTIGQIRDLGKKVGVSLNPATPLSVLDYVLEKVDMVLIMTVNPGFGGQSYIPYCDRKISELKKMITDRGLQVKIEVDGGVTQNNIRHIRECGADIFVGGSSVFNGPIEQNVKDLLAQAGD